MENRPEPTKYTHDRKITEQLLEKSAQLKIKNEIVTQKLEDLKKQSDKLLHTEPPAL